MNLSVSGCRVGVGVDAKLRRRQQRRHPDPPQLQHSDAQLLPVHPSLRQHHKTNKNSHGKGRGLTD